MGACDTPYVVHSIHVPSCTPRHCLQEGVIALEVTLECLLKLGSKAADIGRLLKQENMSAQAWPSAGSMRLCMGRCILGVSWIQRRIQALVTCVTAGIPYSSASETYVARQGEFLRQWLRMGGICPFCAHQMCCQVQLQPSPSRNLACVEISVLFAPCLYGRSLLVAPTTASLTTHCTRLCWDALKQSTAVPRLTASCRRYPKRCRRC
jgi:hypothetical protein